MCLVSLLDLCLLLIPATPDHLLTQFYPCLDDEDGHGHKADPEVELRLHQNGLRWGEMLWRARSMSINLLYPLLFLHFSLGSPHLLRSIAFPPPS